MKFSSVLVGEESSVFGKEMSDSDEEDARKNEEGAAVFSSSWLPGTGNDSQYDSLFLCFSFTDKFSCTHKYMHPSFASSRIGTKFFVLLSQCAFFFSPQDKTS